MTTITGRVSFWYDQIELPSSRQPLPGPIDADVCIVGAGYTGLWTAYYLKKEAPHLRIVLIEERFAGFGASGRNGGWLTNAVTGGREQYTATHGREAAAAMQRAMTDTVDEVIAMAAAEGIDADIHKGGELNVAYNKAQLERLKAAAETELQWDDAVDAKLLSSDESASRVNVVGTLGGLYHPHCARIQPAKLVRGLADVVERLGVEIYEQTRVSEIQPHRAITDRGDVTAAFVLRATEGFTAGLRGLRRAWLPMNSSLIVTEPLSPAIWDTIGWDGRDALGDFAHAYMYAQRTADDRIAFGGRGVPYRYGSRVDNDGTTSERTARQLKTLMNRFFPATADSRIERSWSGVLGVPRDWSATVGLDSATGLGWAGGYVGTGVTSTNLAGRTLRDLVLGKETSLTSLPWVNHRVHNWEVEPLRWFAVHGLYAVYHSADMHEQSGRTTRTSPLAKVANIVAGR
jgi:glycine/D-amino acid oxidase-like deaminating enzyme